VIFIKGSAVGARFVQWFLSGAGIQPEEDNKPVYFLSGFPPAWE